MVEVLTHKLVEEELNSFITAMKLLGWKYEEKPNRLSKLQIFEKGDNKVVVQATHIGHFIGYFVDFKTFWTSDIYKKGELMKLLNREELEM